MKNAYDRWKSTPPNERIFSLMAIPLMLPLFIFGLIINVIALSLMTALHIVWGTDKE